MNDKEDLEETGEAPDVAAVDAMLDILRFVYASVTRLMEFYNMLHHACKSTYNYNINFVASYNAMNSVGKYFRG